MRLRFLGSFEAFYGNEPLRHFRTKAVQALLVYLACQPEAHRRESLMALLWPETTQESAQNSLRQALYHLRQAIPQVTAKDGGKPVPFVLADRQVVQVNPEAVFELDVDTLESGLTGPQEGWSEGVGLYRGDFLEDFYLPDSAPFEEWVLARRADLRRQIMDALDTLVAREMAQGTYEEAERLARRQLAIDNLYELAHRQLMEALARLGRRSQALSHYETCRRLLEEELGIGPTEETERLVEQVRQGELASSPAEPVVLAPQPIRRHNLRPSPTRLIGRERELADLEALAAVPERRLINIVGPGGMGKSRLALAFAEGQLGADGAASQKRYPDGVFFVALQPLRNREEIIAAIAEAVDLPLDSDERRPPQEQLLDFLREKQLLLVLDNFEHLLDEVPLVNEMLAASSALKIMVTSRERIGLYGEQIYALAGLALPEEPVDPSPKMLTGFASAKLFLERTRRVAPGYTPSPEEDTVAIVRLCHLVSGTPLALELAASWMDVLSPGQILAQTRKNLDMLAVELTGMPERHRSMRAVFDGTWVRLSAAEQAALARMSVFRGNFDGPAAESVAGASLQTLTGLVRKSMVHYQPESGRYHLHELLRQYAEERLHDLPAERDGASAESATRQRHSAYYCRLLETWEEGLKGRRQLETIAETAANLDNIRAAWEHAAQTGELALISQAAESLSVFLVLRGHYNQGDRLFGLAVEAVKELVYETSLQSVDQEHLYARLLAHHAQFMDSGAQQEDLARKSLAILERLQTGGYECRQDMAFASLILAMNRHRSGRHREAVRAAQRSLALSEASGDEWANAHAAEMLGRAFGFLGDWVQGERWLETGLLLHRKLGNRHGEAGTLGNLAALAGFVGDEVKAERLTRERISIYEALGNQLQASIALGGLASSLGHRGRFHDSEQLVRDALVRLRRVGNESHTLGPRIGLAIVSEHLGRYEAAKKNASDCLQRAGELNMSELVRVCLRLLITLAIVRGDLDEADRRLTPYQERFPSESLKGVSLVEIFRSFVAVGRQDYPRAARQVRHGLELMLKDRFEPAALWALPAGALLLARLGNVEKGLAVYAAASRQPFVGNSRWFDDVVGAPLREMARALPPRTVQEAEGLGREWDIWQAADRLLEALQPIANRSSPGAVLKTDRHSSSTGRPGPGQAI